MTSESLKAKRERVFHECNGLLYKMNYPKVEDVKVHGGFVCKDCDCFIEVRPMYSEELFA